MSRKNSIHRVLRGGSCNNDTWNLRASSRAGGEPEGRDRNLGFRVVVVRRKQ
jgi:formylglycine-generating enzyme required for sulfatase activity